jgi:hypothetical protein
MSHIPSLCRHTIYALLGKYKKEYNLRCSNSCQIVEQFLRCRRHCLRVEVCRRWGSLLTLVIDGVTDSETIYSHILSSSFMSCPIAFFRLSAVASDNVVSTRWRTSRNLKFDPLWISLLLRPQACIVLINYVTDCARVLCCSHVFASCIVTVMSIIYFSRLANSSQKKCILKNETFLAPMNVPRRGTKRIPFEARGFVYIRFEVWVDGHPIATYVRANICNLSCSWVAGVADRNVYSPHFTTSTTAIALYRCPKSILQLKHAVKHVVYSLH